MYQGNFFYRSSPIFVIMEMKYVIADFLVESADKIRKTYI